MVTLENDNGGMITSIKNIEVDGFIAPITESGKIVVNGIQMSVYTNYNMPEIARIVMKPYHWIIRVIDPSWLHYESKDGTRNIYASILQTITQLFI